MIITYKHIKLITFPIYKLPSDDWYSQDGLLFVEGEIVDDKNMLGASLGIRRLQTYFKDLMPLKYAIETPTALIKQIGGPYIDSAGKCFIYEKTLFCVLSYHKIKRVDKKGTHSLLWVKDVPFPFTIPRPPKVEHTWVGIIHLKGFPWILYEYSDTKLPKTRRKI